MGEVQVKFSIVFTETFIFSFDIIKFISFQSSKPKAIVFCFLISEARQTTPLEMPDQENTFVLKSVENDDRGGRK